MNTGMPRTREYDVWCLHCGHTTRMQARSARHAYQTVSDLRCFNPAWNENPNHLVRRVVVVVTGERFEPLFNAETLP